MTKKSKAARVLEFIDGMQFEYVDVPNAGSVKKAFQAKIDKFEMEGVFVDEVEVDEETAQILVSFSDFEGDEMLVLFGVDEDEGAYATIVDEDDEDETVMEIDLDTMGVPHVNTQHGVYLELSDLSWMNRSTMDAILRAGEIDALMNREGVDAIPVKWNAGGGVIPSECVLPHDGGYLVNEETKTVIRGGKKVKLPVVRNKKKKRLTAKQKMGIQKGVRKRKAKQAQTTRKLQKSLKLRKSSGLKKGTKKGHKVKG